MSEKLIVHKLPDFDYLEIYPITDFHDGDPKTDETMFKNFVKHIEADERRYWLYAGDNLNNAIKSSVSNVYNEKRSPHEQKEDFIETMRPVAGKCLCLIPGNHESRSAKESDVHLVWDIACRLVGDDKARELYRENEAFIKISFGKYSQHRKHAVPVTYVGWIHHGVGGGMYVGATVNKLQLRTMAIEGVDFAVQGHVHKGKVGHKFDVRQIDPRNDVVIQKQILNVICCAWSDFGGYGARKMMLPGTKGPSCIILNGRRKEATTII
jgi:UDP-2,3-diacylglucosamine pyrophosphatase LpxH